MSPLSMAAHPFISVTQGDPSEYHLSSLQGHWTGTSSPRHGGRRVAGHRHSQDQLQNQTSRPTRGHAHEPAHTQVQDVPLHVEDNRGNSRMKKKKTSGSQSAPCPVTPGRSKTPCGANSGVIRTRRVGDTVIRARYCVRGHRFTTEEKSQSTGFRKSAPQKTASRPIERRS